MQDSPKAVICAAVQTASDYYDAMIAGDAAKLRALFDPRAPIVGNFEDEYQRLDLEGFIAEAVSLVGQHSADGGTVESVRIDGDIATVVIRGHYMGQIFVDHLSMIDQDGRWKIIAKTFHARP